MINSTAICVILTEKVEKTSNNLPSSIFSNTYMYISWNYFFYQSRIYRILLTINCVFLQIVPATVVFQFASWAFPTGLPQCGGNDTENITCLCANKEHDFIDPLSHFGWLWGLRDYILFYNCYTTSYIFLVLYSLMNDSYVEI